MEFKCHKHILASRSSVFRSMFTSGLAEAVEGTVRIKDFEPSIVESMLKFLYSGRVEDGVLEKSADKLVAIADKYDLSELKAGLLKI